MATSDGVSSALMELQLAQTAIGTAIAGGGDVAQTLTPIGQHVGAAIAALSDAAREQAGASSSSSSPAIDGAAAAAADVGTNAGGTPQPTRDVAELRTTPAPAPIASSSSSSDTGETEGAAIRRRLNVIESRLEALENGQVNRPASSSSGLDGMLDAARGFGKQLLEGAAAASHDVGRGQGRALSLESGGEPLEGAAAAAADVGKGR